MTFVNVLLDFSQKTTEDQYLILTMDLSPLSISVVNILPIAEKHFFEKRPLIDFLVSLNE